MITFHANIQHISLQPMLCLAKSTTRQGLASTGGWESRKPILEAPMINRSPQYFAPRLGLLVKTKQLKAYFYVGIILLTGCTATQVRWDATKMRKDVMVYYNDQIMDNLIRAKHRLPFVHVDITLLTSQGGSQISGTIGAGENRTSEHTSRSMADAVGTLTKTLAHPFAYSVTPQQTETLTISAAPALGSQAVAASLRTQSPILQLTKKSETTETTYPTPSPGTAGTSSPGIPSPATSAPITKESTTTEEQPIQRTIYDLYQDFADHYVKESPTRPNKDDVLPGTVVKSWDCNYYYIDKNVIVSRKTAKDAYYEFCTALFTKGQAGLLGAAFQQGLAAPLAVPTFR
jgi:hypothetical protein